MENSKKAEYPKKRRFVMLGYGSVAKSTIPVFVKEIPDRITEMIIIDRIDVDEKEMEKYLPVKATYLKKTFTSKNYIDELKAIIKDYDCIVDMFGMTNSLDVVEVCNERKGTIYGNSSYEVFPDSEIYDFVMSGYYREFYKRINKTLNNVKSTSFNDSGANPGLITHFVRIGLKHMGEDAVKRGVKDSEKIKEILSKGDYAELAEQLKVDVIHISEHEKITPANMEPFKGKCISSWNVEGFHEEFTTRAEAAIGTHDQEDLSKPGYEKLTEFTPPTSLGPLDVYLKTSCPFGIFTGRTVSHFEVLEISQLFSTKTHSPTVAFVYHPSDISVKCFKEKDWENLPKATFNEWNAGPLAGREVMGASLISSREDIPIRWYGSVVTCEQSREVGCITNPTTLQVAAGLFSHIMLALEEPEKGLCHPGSFDSEKIMKYAAPYLGTIWDCNLDFRLPTRWSELLSNEDNFNQNHLTF